MVLIKIVGPMFMQNRKPYDLLGIIKAYNIMQIIYNTVSLVFVSDLEVLLVMNINFDSLMIKYNIRQYNII